MTRLFSVNKWCFALGPPRVGVWDRFTSDGVKVKDGTESVFNEENLGQMVENFGNRANDLAMCYDHQSAYVAQNGQPAPALAFYNALALVWEGKVAKFASHSPEVQPPDCAGLPNGVYGFRSEITEMGEKLLSNYKFISPMFTDQGADESGNEIGYDLMDVAATNVPFQDGVALTFHKGSAAMRPAKKETYSMDPEMMKKLGLAEGCSDDEMKGAMTAHLAKYFAEQDAAAEEAKKMAEAPEEEKKDKEEDKPAEKMADEPEDKEKDKDKKEMSEEDDDMKAMSKALGLDGVVSRQTIRFAIESRMHQVRDAVAMRAELETLRAERVALQQEALTAEAANFAETAIADGRWQDDNKDGLITVYKKSPDDAKAVLFKKGTFTLVQKNFSRQLQNRPDRADATERKPGPVTMGADFSSMAKTYAKENKVSLMDAQAAVAKSHPDLYKAYKAGE